MQRRHDKEPAKSDIIASGKRAEVVNGGSEWEGVSQMYEKSHQVPACSDQQVAKDSRSSAQNTSQVNLHVSSGIRL